MKRLSRSAEAPRFKGALRHYHRAASRRSSWDQWVNADARRSGLRIHMNWLKILGILVALMALGGVIAGLIIELRGA